MIKVSKYLAYIHRLINCFDDQFLKELDPDTILVIFLYFGRYYYIKCRNLKLFIIAYIIIFFKTKIFKYIWKNLKLFISKIYLHFSIEFHVGIDLLYQVV